MALATLSVDLIAKLATFEQDLGKAARASEKTAQQITAAIGTIKTAFAGLAAGVTVGAFTLMVKDAIDAADHLRDLSQTTGIAVEALGGLGFAATQNGGTLESVTAAAGKLNKTIAEAAAGSKEALQPFEALGISVKDAAGQTKAADVVFAELADKFQNFKDGPEKAALALRLFGKAGADQIALLNEGGEALRANIEYYKRYSGVTKEVAEQADQFNDTLGKINLIQRSLGTNIASALLPSLQAVADEFLRMKESGSSFSVLADSLRVVFETSVVLGANLRFVLVSIGREIGAIAAQAVALGRLDIKGFSAISEAVIADGRRARSELDLLERRILNIGRLDPNDQSAAESRRLGLSSGAKAKVSAPSLPALGGGSGKEKVDKGFRDATTDLDRYLVGLLKTIEKEQELTTVQIAQLRIAEAGAQGFSEIKRRYILDLAAQIDKEKELTAAQEERIKIGRQVAIDQGADNSARSERLAQLAAASEGGQFKARQADLALLQEELDRFNRTLGEYGINAEEYADQVRALFGINKDGLEKTKSLAEELGLSFTSAFEDAIVGGKKFSDILRGLEQDILRIVTRKLVTEPLGNALTGLLGGSGGGSSGGGVGGFLSGIFGKLFSADGGGYTGAGARSGGLDGKGGFLGMLHPDETVLDHTRGQRGGNSVSITVNQSFGAGTSRATTLQAAGDARRQLEYAGRNL